jgi:hypothetical protein
MRIVFRKKYISVKQCNEYGETHKDGGRVLAKEAAIE